MSIHRDESDPEVTQRVLPPDSECAGCHIPLRRFSQNALGTGNWPRGHGGGTKYDVCWKCTATAPFFQPQDVVDAWVKAHAVTAPPKTEAVPA